jgi:hypothetical protein
LLVLAAALVRVWHLAYGLPDVYHPDEARIVARAVRVHAGELNPHFFNWPSLSVYLLAAVYGVVGATSPDGIVPAFARDPATFYLVGRLVTVAFGSATIVALYSLAAPLYGAWIGLLAGLFLAADLLHVHDSRFVTTDVPMTALVVFAVARALRYGRTGRPRDAAVAGALAGLATSAKYPGALAFLPLVLAGLGRARGGVAGHRVTRDLGLGMALAVVGFVVGTPFALLAPAEFVRGVLAEVGEVHSVQFGNEADLAAPLFHLLHSLPTALGVPLSLLAVVGLGLVLVRGGGLARAWLAFPIPYFAVITAWSSRFERYAVPVLPFAALLAALALPWLAEVLRKRVPVFRRVPRSSLVLVATVLVLLPQVAHLVAFHRLLGYSDSREVAATWIERQVPSGARIALEPYGPSLPVAGTVFAETPGTALLDLARSPAGGAGAVAPPAVVAPAARGGYRIVRLNSYEPGWLARERVEYVVLSGFVYRRHLQVCDRHPAPCRLYQELERRAVRVLTVESGADDGPLWVGDIYAPLTRLSERVRPGPTIRIYRLPADFFPPS